MPTPLQYINSLEEPRRSDIKTLHSLICKTAPKLKPFVLESAHGDIIGYGKQPYETKSGCKGEWFTVGIASRKQGIALYICSVKNGKYLAEIYQPKFPKLKIGKSCIMIKKLENIDMKAVESIVKEAASIGMTFS